MQINLRSRERDQDTDRRSAGLTRFRNFALGAYLVPPLIRHALLAVRNLQMYHHGHV